ncbi:Double-stranded RNA binding motif family protein [Brugia malayi]|uniref:BMA-RDE-4 n=1 Tax=Brugia malayi TaxID=6279 RepID=A0A0J9Y0J0_BRUMA|nr:Double-stranded RNA binding motif family protein [Brugia malayi]CDP99324.1 BMA-RDE-4 [Brugia malayi]VIO90797.1 Double-stranded RNA binding motif family protein [Brugia malayi]
MVEKLYDVFTHVDVLKSREPEYFICEKPIIVDFDSLIGNKNSKSSKEIEKMEKLNVMDTDNERIVEMQQNEELLTSSTGISVTPTKTFVSILEEGCKKYYDGSPPVFTSNFVEMRNLFATRCELYGIYTMGYGRTKKIAKQMAAKDMLKKMIEKESFSDFGLGKTKEEALANLENLTIDFQNRGSTDDSVVENWVGKVNERCQKLKLLNATYEIDEEGPTNQRIFIATCTVGKIHVVAHGKTKKIAKTLAAQKMCTQLENWKDLAYDVENAMFPLAAAAAASQETTSSNESAANNLSPSASRDAVMPLQSLQKVRAAFQNGNGTQDFTKKLTELINSDDENINRIFLNQKLKFIFLEPDLDGNLQCMLSINGPNDMKNAFYGFGATEEDAKDYAARIALIHLELFMRTPEPTRNSTNSSETQVAVNSLTQAKNPPENGSQNSSPEKQ